MKPVPGGNHFSYGSMVDNSYPDPARVAALLAANHDRAQLGLPPLRYDEFVGVGNLLRGARDYWTPEKLAEKAKKQLRDPKTKQWVEQRGNLNMHRAARARIGKNTEPADELNTPRTVGTGWKKLGPPPASSPKTKVTRLTGDNAIEAMVAVGHPRALTGIRYRDRGVIFQVDNPGRNPVHVFVANPAGMVRYRMAVQDNNVRNAQVALQKFEEQAAAKIRAGDPEAVAMLQMRRQVVGEAHRLRLSQKKAAEDHYGTGGDEVIGEMEEALASEAAALHLEAIAGWPRWKLLREDGTPLPFVLEFDESKLVKGEGASEGDRDLPMATISHVTPARAAEGNRINFNRNVYRQKLSTVRKGHFTTSDRDTVGQHASAHEPGHLLDPRATPGHHEPWDSRMPAFADYIQTSHEYATSQYAKSNPREWAAEMHAMAAQDQENLKPNERVAVQAYLNLFMIQNLARPEKPSTEWVAANRAWMAKAYQATLIGREPPPLPDPADFFELPRPKVYKKPGWKLPWEK